MRGERMSRSQIRLRPSIEPPSWLTEDGPMAHVKRFDHMHCEIAMLRPPDGGSRLELLSFVTPDHVPGFAHCDGP